MLIDRRQTLISMGAAALMLTLPAAMSFSSAFADEATAPMPYTAAAFDAAQKAGKPILIDTYATWCQICARQAPILEKLRTEPKFKNLIIFKVNFDTQKDVLRKFHASVQSTLIAFNGAKEVGRSTGETQPEWIEDLVEKSLPNSTM